MEQIYAKADDLRFMETFRPLITLNKEECYPVISRVISWDFNAGLFTSDEYYRELLEKNIIAHGAILIKLKPKSTVVSFVARNESSKELIIEALESHIAENEDTVVWNKDKTSFEYQHGDDILPWAIKTSLMMSALDIGIRYPLTSGSDIDIKIGGRIANTEYVFRNKIEIVFPTK